MNEDKEKELLNLLKKQSKGIVSNSEMLNLYIVLKKTVINILNISKKITPAKDYWDDVIDLSVIRFLNHVKNADFDNFKALWVYLSETVDSVTLNEIKKESKTKVRENQDSIETVDAGTINRIAIENYRNIKVGDNWGEIYEIFMSIHEIIIRRFKLSHKNIINYYIFDNLKNNEIMNKIHYSGSDGAFRALKKRIFDKYEKLILKEAKIQLADEKVSESSKNILRIIIRTFLKKTVTKY